MKKIFFSFAIMVAALGFTKANAAETKITQQEEKITVTVSASEPLENAINKVQDQAKDGGWCCYVAKITGPYTGMDGGTYYDITVNCFYIYAVIM